MKSLKPPAVSTLAANADICLSAAGAIGTVVAVTILAGWPWALLAASLLALLLGVFI